MIRENELIAQFAVLERQVLTNWIEEGVSSRSATTRATCLTRSTNLAWPSLATCTIAWVWSMRACLSSSP